MPNLDILVGWPQYPGIRIHHSNLELQAKKCLRKVIVMPKSQQPIFLVKLDLKASPVKEKQYCSSSLVLIYSTWTSSSRTLRLSGLLE